IFYLWAPVNGEMLEGGEVLESLGNCFQTVKTLDAKLSKRSTSDDGNFCGPHSEMGFFNRIILSFRKLGGQSPVATSISGQFNISKVVNEMSADVARSHDSDGEGEDCPFHTMYLAVAWVALLTEMSADVARSHGSDDQGEDRPLHTIQRQTKTKFRRQGSRQAEYPRQDPKSFLKGITDTKGPVLIQFELRDKQTVMPLGDHVTHWSSYIGEVIRGVPLYYPFWLKVPKERKATLITDIRTQFNLRPHMESPDWTEINAGIQLINHREEKHQEGNNSPEIETLTYHVLATYGCQQTLPGPTAVTVEVRIAPHYTMYPAVAWVALLTKTQFDLRPHMESPDWTEINAGIQQHLQKAYNTNKAAFKARHWVIDPTTETYNVEKIRRERPKNITAREWDKNIARAAQNGQNRAKSTVLSRQGSRSLARLRDEMMQNSTTQEYPSLIDTFFVAHTINREFLLDKDRRIYEEMMRLEAMGTYTEDEINRLARGGNLHKKVDFMMSIFKSDSRYSDMFSQFESGGASRSGGCGDEEEGADQQDDEDEDGDSDT
nr:hypothetical protein [Tanacetum cinerariifolium]